MRYRVTGIAMTLAASAVLVAVALAASPPGIVNYQGVLRDASDHPLDGDHDMVFRFYSAEAGGDEILIDRHTASDGVAVTVSGGLFSVRLGTGAVQDGTGPGTYASLAEVFRDYGEVWLRVEVGGEILDPRVQVVASAYALNADQLDGKSAGEFLDTSSDAQTKFGRLTISSAAPGLGGLRVLAREAAYFEDTDDSGLAYLADGNWGIGAYGNAGGGHFEDTDASGYANVGRGDTGIEAYGNGSGGYFQDLDGSGYAYVGYGASGIEAAGLQWGGRFRDSDASGLAYLGVGSRGIDAFGNQTGGYFEDTDQSGYAWVANGNWGIGGYGNSGGGYFEDTDSSGFARVGWSDYGIYAQGNFAGGEFFDGDETGRAVVGHQNWGIWASGDGVYGMGGEFHDNYHGTWAQVADQALKIKGNGSVDFVQNHPDLPDRVIVYAAPEGDEVATYTRGSARLVSGEARVALGETFRWVTNPDIGLTVHLTPREEAVPLAVAFASTEEIVVVGPEGSNVAFDYLVYGLRIGFEEASVVQEKTIESFIPSMQHERARYVRNPEFRKYNALERFKEMVADVSGGVTVDLSGAARLKAAVQEYDPAIHGPADQLLGHAPPRRPDEAGEEAPLGANPAGDARIEHQTSQDRSWSPPSGSADDAVSSGDDEVARLEGTTGGGTVQPRGDLLPVSTRVEEGQVLVLDPAQPGKARPAVAMADPMVIGVAGGGSSGTEEEPGTALVVLSGLAECNVDAGYGAIRPGDLLTASPTPGHAMRAMERTPGTILGKAIEPLDAGTGTIKILVMPR